MHFSAWRQDLGSQTSLVSRWIFLRLLGLIYAIAFISLWTQLDGLVGSQGILPVGQLLQAAREQLGPERYWLLPTLCWFNASDGFLHAVCGSGVVCSLLLILDIAPAVALVGLYLLYLSLLTVCREFLGFQWDILLLEAGFLAIFFAPPQLLPKRAQAAPPQASVLWLLRWLLFRLMVSSGTVKLASGDLAWRDFTALTYHYETQPLPTWIGWYMHQLPMWFHRVSVGVMFMIELVVPFLIFGPRRYRVAACGALVAFQLLIAATGNYGFFNLLTIALCLLLLNDEAWPQRVREAVLRRQGRERGEQRRWPRWVTTPVAALVILLSTLPIVELVHRGDQVPSPLVRLYGWVAPFHLVNSYGLFAVMTTLRPEIIVEGSNDGTTWLAYEFRYKPGDLAKRPGFVAPHQPRLDWQMWFAALGSYRSNEWFLAFCERLLTGSPPVLRLLGRNPFPGAPPHYLRAVVYEYHFTDLATKRRTGIWWRREPRGLYCPMLSLRGR